MTNRNYLHFAANERQSLYRQRPLVGFLVQHSAGIDANTSSNLAAALRQAGVMPRAIKELQGHGIGMASDFMDWDRARLLKVPHVGHRTADIIQAFVEAQ